MRKKHPPKTGKALVRIAIGSGTGAMVCAFAPPLLELQGDMTTINSLALTFGVVFTSCVGAITIEALR